MFPDLAETRLPAPLLREILNELKDLYPVGTIAYIEPEVTYFRGRTAISVSTFLDSNNLVEPEDGLFTVRVCTRADDDGDVIVYVIDPSTGESVSHTFWVDASTIKRSM